MKWNISDLRTDIRVMSFRYPIWNPCTPSAASPVAVWKISPPSFYNFISWIPWFQFLDGALKNVLKQRFSAFWARVDQVLLNRRLSEKHEGTFYEWNGLLQDFGRQRVMNDTWSQMKAIHSRLDCGIWWFRLENIADLKTTFCGD